MYKKFNIGSGFLTSRYLMALLVPLFITGAMQITWPFFEHNPIALYLLAVIFCAWYGGLRPGLLCVAISFLLSDLFFVEPYSLFQFHKQGDLVRVVLFIIIGPTISLLSELMHRERRRAGINLETAKCAERLLREKESFANQIAELSPFVIVVFDVGMSRDVYISPDVVNLVGYTPKELQEMEDVFSVLGYPDDIPGARENLARLKQARNGEIIEFEYRIRRRDGEWRWVATRGISFERDEHGEVRQIVTASLDITERKRAEEALRESEERYRIVSETASKAIITIDESSKILFVNPSAEHIFGYSAKEMLGEQLTMLMPEYLRHVHKAGLNRYVESSRKHISWIGTEFPGLHKKGHEIPLEVSFGEAVKNGEHYLTGIARDITNRKRVEQALRQSEQDFRNLFEQAHDAIIVFDPEHEIVLDVNDRACEVYGFTRSEFIGMSLEAISKDVVRGKNEISKTLETGHYLNFETVQYRKDGTEMFLEVNASTIRFQGQLVILSINRDVTERKRIEEKLRQGESQLSEAQKLASVGSWNWEIQNKRNTWSEELYRICGLHPKETQPSYEAFIQLVHPDDRAVVKETFKHTLQTKQPIDCYVRIIRPDGAERIIHSRGNTISDIDGVPIRMHGTVQDVTERKQAEDALGEAERKYRSIFENAVEGIFQTTADGRFISANPALARMLGFDSPEELKRLRTNIAHDHYVNPQSREEFKQAMEENGFVFNFELEAYRKDRSKIWISENVRAVRDEQGSILYYEGTSEDITDRKRDQTRSTAFASLAHKLSGAWTALNAGRIIAETADELFGWDSCTLDLYDLDRDEIHSILNIDTIDGQKVSVAPLVSGQRPTPRSRRIIDHGPELILREEPFEFDGDAVPIGDTSRPSAAIMTSPIRHASRVIGILSFQSYTPRAYDDVALGDLQALSDHCGEALNRLHAENQLQESEERYRDLVENSHDLICTHDLDGFIISANRAALETMGYPSASYAGAKNLREILPPETRDQFNDYLTRIRADGVATGLMAVQTQTGEKRIWEYQNTLRTQGVAAPIVRGMARDITEQRRVEKALRESESFRRMIIEAGPECVKVVAPNYALLDMNPAGLKMIEATSREQVIGQSVLNLVAPESRSIFMEMHERVCQGESVVTEFEIVGLKGTPRWMESHAAPLFDKESNVIAQLAITRDVTERKRTRESLKLFRNLIDQSSDAIEVLEPNTLRFLDCNATAHRSLGYTREEFLALTAFDIDPVVDQETLARQSEDMEKSGFVIFESIHRRKDGSTFPVEINAKNIRLERNYRLAIVRDITDRKRVDAALRDAERKYRDIFENAGEGIFQSTPDGRFLAANPTLAKMHGFASPEELIHNSPDIQRQIYVDAGRREDFKRLLAEQGAVRDFECQVFRKDRSKIWNSVNARVVRDEKGEIQYYEGTAQDITDRKRAEEALRESEECYRDLVENSLDLICTHDLDGLLLSANRAAMELMGYSSGTYAGGINFRQILAAEVRDQFDDYLKRIRTDGAASGLMLVETSCGEKRIWEYHCTLRTEGIAAPIVRGVARDITERRLAAEALRESEARYRELFENARDAIYVQDLGGVYTSVNRAAEKLSGYDRNEIIGKHFSHFIAPEYLPLVRANISKKLVDKGETAYEIEVVSKAGKRVPVELSSGLIFEHGVAVGIQGIARDVTERKRAEQALRSYSRRLIEAQEAERQHIARELHDQIGQVLTAIRINLHTVGNSCETEESRSLVDQGVGLVDAAIEQVRDLSFELRPSLLDNLGLAAALRWYSDQYTQRTGIRTKSASNLPEGKIRLRQELETACFRIVQEALTNVVRHANAKNVFIDLKQVDHKLVLSIKDDGIGFNEPTNGDVSATRLGLRGMKERALALGGALNIKSGPAQGTEIRATFPAVGKED